MRNVFEDFVAVVKQYQLDLTHIIHVGAHKGEEMKFYKEAGIKKFTLVEPNPELARIIKDLWPEATVLSVACGPRGEATLSINRISSSSSIAAPHPDDKIVGEVQVSVVPLSDVSSDCDVAIIDAQGLELEVLKTGNLEQFKMVICETSTVRDQTMASFYEDVVSYMYGQGFTAVDHWTRDYGWIYGAVRLVTSPEEGEVRDVIFIRNDLIQ